MEKFLNYWYVWAALIIIAGFALGKTIATPASTSTTSPSGAKQRGGCIKHTGVGGSVWYTYGGVEVSKADCEQRGYL